jgi:hypothetical protein
MPKTKEKKKSSASNAPKPKSDAYTMMLFITLLAIAIGCTLLYLDFEEYGKQAAPKENPPALPKLGDAPAKAATSTPDPMNTGNND